MSALTFQHQHQLRQQKLEAPAVSAAAAVPAVPTVHPSGRHVPPFAPAAQPPAAMSTPAPYLHSTHSDIEHHNVDTWHFLGRFARFCWSTCVY